MALRLTLLVFMQVTTFLSTVCRNDDAQSPVVVKLAIWCLNPAVAFAELAAQSHSIILTSGTLSPIVSFASEVVYSRE